MDIADVSLAVLYTLLFPGFLFTAVVGLFLTWVDRKVTAVIQSRMGPPWFQPFADIGKLLAKRMILPRGAQPLGFLGAPLLSVVGATLAAVMTMRALFEFIAARSRHPMRIRMKTGVLKDGTLTANEMRALSDTGAYGCHALTVTGNTGHKSMALYVGNGAYRANPNIRFYADIVYTNHAPAGAFRGYGVPQGYWAVERHMEKIARKLGLDPIEFRLKNALRAGELHPFSTAWSEGREPRPETIETCALEECTRQGRAACGWDIKYGRCAIC